MKCTRIKNNGDGDEVDDDDVDDDKGGDTHLDQCDLKQRCQDELCDQKPLEASKPLMEDEY